MVTWSARHCAPCRGKITWLGRLELADEWAKTLLVIGATCLGVLLGLVVFNIPRPTAPTAITAVILCWYLQDLIALRPASEMAT
jgi:hypothetical protein